MQKGKQLVLAFGCGQTNFCFLFIGLCARFIGKTLQVHQFPSCNDHKSCSAPRKGRDWRKDEVSVKGSLLSDVWYSHHGLLSWTQPLSDQQRNWQSFFPLVLPHNILVADKTCPLQLTVFNPTLCTFCCLWANWMGSRNTGKIQKEFNGSFTSFPHSWFTWMGVLLILSFHPVKSCKQDTLHKF